MKQTKVMLILDDRELSENVYQHLTRQQYEVIAHHHPPQALDYVKQHPAPHIALVSLRLPVMHGFEVASKLKAIINLPVIAVLSLHDVESIATSLHKYAEDFIVTPFDLRELCARVALALHRAAPLPQPERTVGNISPDVKVDFVRNTLTIGQNVINLTPIESALLQVLVQNSGRVVENKVLMERVWPEDNITEDVLRVHMHRLRRKLEADAHHPRYIRTERGVGYLLLQQ